MSKMIPDPVSLRLWPGVLLAVFAVLMRFALPLALPGVAIFGMDSEIIGLIGSVVGTLGILVWWLFASRAPWSERLGAVAVMVVAAVVTRAVAHESITGAGMGILIFLMGTQLMCLALVAWAVASRGLSAGTRRASMAAAIVAGFGVMAIIRTDGVSSGPLGSDYHWRWTPTAEELLLAQAVEEPKPLPPAAPIAAVPEVMKETAVAPIPPVATAAAETGLAMSEGGGSPKRDASRVEWPGFRGPLRDSAIHGVRINSDWSAAPPVQIWRKPIGPGWSSFAVLGDLIYTQEQRGNDEIVSCYRLSTGEPVWRHRDPIRFYESNGGAGPRATPTIDHGRVFAHGATGVVNALDAATGEQRWLMKSRGGSYSSPHLLTIDGIPQVVLMGGQGTTAVAAADGTVLWDNKWAGTPMVQPANLAGGDLLITSADAMSGLGVRRIGVTHGASGWTIAERWTSRGLKPYFNDYVIHKGHAFGFDGNILSAINLETGERAWKGGRYGNGQMLLLADQDLLLVTSEEGELALVSATPDKYTEMAKFPALNAKTWNHPVLIGDVLLVRNGEEMVAFRLSLTPAAGASAP